MKIIMRDVLKMLVALITPLGLMLVGLVKALGLGLGILVGFIILGHTFLQPDGWIASVYPSERTMRDIILSVIALSLIGPWIGLERPWYAVLRFLFRGGLRGWLRVQARRLSRQRRV